LQLWLTQRLAGRLVKVLVARLNDESGSRDRAKAFQAWELSAAKAQHVPTNPVAGAAMSEHLILSIDVASTAQGAQLTFHGRERDVGVLMLELTALRQWLAILHQHYRNAQWSCQNLWPEWFAAASSGAPTAMAGAVLH
jgi:hypothetical protein